MCHADYQTCSTARGGMSCPRIDFQVGQARVNTLHIRYEKGGGGGGGEEAIYCRYLTVTRTRVQNIV